jgi:hypothetical protein
LGVLGATSGRDLVAGVGEWAGCGALGEEVGFGVEWCFC